LIRNAKLKAFAELEATDYRASRALDRVMVPDLLTCSWIEHRQNVRITGHTGTGKDLAGLCSFGKRSPTGRIGGLQADGPADGGNGDRPRRWLFAEAAWSVGPYQPTDSGRLRADALESTSRTDLLGVMDDRVGSGATIVAAIRRCRIGIA
jgi:hypothetical protein